MVSSTIRVAIVKERRLKDPQRLGEKSNPKEGQPPLSSLSLSHYAYTIKPGRRIVATTVAIREFWRDFFFLLDIP